MLVSGNFEFGAGVHYCCILRSAIECPVGQRGGWRTTTIRDKLHATGPLVDVKYIH